MKGCRAEQSEQLIEIRQSFSEISYVLERGREHRESYSISTKSWLIKISVLPKVD